MVCLTEIRTRWKSVAAVILAGALVGAGWYNVQGRHAKDLADPERARKEGRPIPVRTAQVSESEVVGVIGATAVTTPSYLGQIRVGLSNGFKLSDVVVKVVHVHEGDQVTRGQLLFELDDTLYGEIVKQRTKALAYARAELKRVQEEVSYQDQLRKLDLESAKANLVYRNEDLRGRTVEYEAAKKLFNKTISKNQEYYDAAARYVAAHYYQAEAERQLERAKISMQTGELRDRESVAQAEANVETARVALEVAQRDVERCRVTSPLDGFMDRVPIVPGQVIAVDTVLASVLQLEPIHVRVDFPQERMDEIRVGQEAEIVLDSFPKETFRGTVIRISPQVNPQLRVFPVVVELRNPKHRIKAGITGYVRFPIRKKLLTVPATAVVQEGSKAMVFRVEDGRARLREIVTGPLADTGVVEVRAGLAAGDEVVIFHNFYRDAGQLSKGEGYLQDNDPVDADWRKWAGRE